MFGADAHPMRHDISNTYLSQMHKQESDAQNPANATHWWNHNGMRPTPLTSDSTGRDRFQWCFASHWCVFFIDSLVIASCFVILSIVVWPELLISWAIWLQCTSSITLSIQSPQHEGNLGYERTTSAVYPCTTIMHHEYLHVFDCFQIDSPLYCKLFFHCCKFGTLTTIPGPISALICFLCAQNLPLSSQLPT